MKWITRSSAALLLALGLLPAAGRLLGQTIALPIEFRHVYEGDTRINYLSRAGVPISQTVGSPPGSNGLQPTGNESTGVYVPPTAGQFRGFMSFGAVPGLKFDDWVTRSNSLVLQEGTTPFSVSVAGQMQLPRAAAASLPGSAIILRRATIGAPYLSRQVTMLFGQVVIPPASDETGALLPEDTASSYWLAEPYTTTAHAGAGYYWSPHARLVYAIQPGPITIAWVKATPYNTGNLPTTYVNPNGSPNFVTNGANIFILYTENYVVSGSPVKPPRKMYWTQKGFQRIGKPILVPAARVGAVNVVYNNNFPEAVTEEFSGVGDTSPTTGTTNAPLPELRTLWFEQQQGVIYAYNAEGRVFVELLGDLRSDNRTYQPLGTEIVDVFKQPLPLDVTVELGERVVPPEDGSLEELVPEPINQISGPAFAFRHNAAGNGRVEYWATRETINLNDFLVHWMETGEAGLQWPKLFGRYALRWPTEIEKYSLYVRPDVLTETESQATAIALDPSNAPIIEYQDPLDQPRAKFTPDFRFYTHLDSAQPAHRTLLRYTSGEYIGFERVFSWRVDNLRDADFSFSPVATSLSAWNGMGFDWPDDLKAPRVVSTTANVGARIVAPSGEPGGPGSATYLAGFINTQVGNSYNPGAYLNPFDVGFDAAAAGAVIPVNAIPGSNLLEVWWFRRSEARVGLNAGNGVLGFRTNTWPSAIGRYTIQWPTSPPEIVLASLKGGTNLSVAQQKGRIYYENTVGATGYNPNEEHAVMSGGTPYATRDDLNITNAAPGVPYSSAPFVLLDYKDTDGRPAMVAFKVLREKPSVGWVFDYIVPAGKLLQPPPPLTFLQKPVEGTGEAAFSYNTEPIGGGGDLPGGGPRAMPTGRSAIIRSSRTRTGRTASGSIGVCTRACPRTSRGPTSRGPTASIRSMPRLRSSANPSASRSTWRGSRSTSRWRSPVPPRG